MSDHKENDIIVTETNSNNISSTHENNEDVKSSCNTEGLEVDKGSISIKSMRDENYCENMPLIGPSIPVTSMSTSPIIEKSPSSNFGTPLATRNNVEKVTPVKYTMSLVSDYGYSDDEDAIIEMHNINKDLLPVVHIKEEIMDSDMDQNISQDYQNEKIEYLPKVINSSEVLNGDEGAIIEMHNINKDLLPVVHIKEEIMDSDMDQNISQDYQNEKIEYSPKVTNSSEVLNGENEDAIVETERHNIDKNLLPVILIKEEVEILESDTEENFSKDSQNENIEFSSKFTNSSRLLNEENAEKYRYTVDIASGTDDSESDSDDSSSDGFSSSSESSSDSEDETTTKTQTQLERDASKIGKELHEEPSPDEQALCKLPPIEDLRITVSENESQPIGTIFSIVEQQVVIQALPNVPPIDLESILFLENGKRALGKVFDVFGKVQEPLYTVRFNSNDHIKQQGFNIGDPVYFAPQTEHTQFVVLSDLMRAKGSDASWENNKEPPSRYVDYSDDEQESAARQQRKQDKLLAEGIPVNEFKPQRKRPRGQGQNPNPFSNSGSRPSRAPVRYAQRQHNQPWMRPSGPRGQARVPPAMHHHHNPDHFGQYDQWNGEYQFGGPPQFPPAGPSNNWHQTGPGPNWMHAGPNPNWHQPGPGNNWPHSGPGMPMGPPGMNDGPPPHMGPPQHHGGPPHMPHMHQPPPQPYPDAPVPHQNHTYPGPSQENWWAPGTPPANYYPPPNPPPQRHF